MQEGERADTFHTHLDQTLDLPLLGEAERIQGLGMGLGRGDMYLSPYGMAGAWGTTVKFSPDADAEGKAVTRIWIEDYSESSSSVGEGYYEVFVDGKGTAAGGYTEYRYNGHLERQCRIEAPLAQKIADAVFRAVLDEGKKPLPSH